MKDKKDSSLMCVRRGPLSFLFNRYRWPVSWEQSGRSLKLTTQLQSIQNIE
jgi:hypothetical protein